MIDATKKVFMVQNEICRRRSLDQTRLANYFSRNNCIIVDKPEDADFIIFMSCGLTKPRADTGIKYIKKYKKFRGELIVLGCLQDTDPKRFNKVFAQRHLPTRNHEEIDKFFPEFKVKYAEIPDANDRYGEQKDYKLIRISYGCNQKCAYCAARKAFGLHKSKPKQAILDNYRELIKKGFRYFMICGEDIGAYGTDINSSLPELLNEMSEIDKDLNVRWRVPEINPIWAVTYKQELKKIIALRKISYISFPIQSGSKRILELMNRFVDIDELVEVINGLKASDPNIFVDTHVIVGFPTETEKDCNDTLDLVDKIDFDNVMVFKFSEREGTLASEIKGKIKEKVKNNRVKNIINFLNSRNKTYIFQNFDMKEIDNKSPNNSLARIKTMIKRILRWIVSRYFSSERILALLPEKRLLEIKDKLQENKTIRDPNRITLTGVFQNLHHFQLNASEREWKQLCFYYEMMHKIKDIPGDLAEFGVAGGISFISFIRILLTIEKGLDHKEVRKIYGFDSFEGLPELAEYDKSKSAANVEMVKGGFDDPDAYLPLFEFVEKHNHVFLIKGWFKNTLPGFLKDNPHLGLAFVHIDCDLYESVRVILENIWDYIVPGGIVLFDELYHKDFPGEATAFKETMRGRKYQFCKSQIKPDKKYLIKLSL